MTMNTKRYRFKRGYSHFKVLPMSDVDASIKQSACNGGCKTDTLVRQIGPFGAFYNCRLCGANIPEDEDGMPAKPIGVCNVCRSYLYPAVGKTGVIWNSCSHFKKHTKQKA